MFLNFTYLDKTVTLYYKIEFGVGICNPRHKKLQSYIGIQKKQQNVDI